MEARAEHQHDKAAHPNSATADGLSRLAVEELQCIIDGVANTTSLRRARKS
jgi:hypothetical protein